MEQRQLGIHRIEIQRKPHRIRKLAHSILPNIVEPPEPINGRKMRHGDRMVHIYPDGSKHSVMVVPSAEAVRFAYTATPLPREFHQPDEQARDEHHPEDEDYPPDTAA